MSGEPAYGLKGTLCQANFDDGLVQFNHKRIWPYSPTVYLVPLLPNWVNQRIGIRLSKAWYSTGISWIVNISAWIPEPGEEIPGNPGQGQGQGQDDRPFIIN